MNFLLKSGKKCLMKNKFKVIYYGFDNKNFFKNKEFQKTLLYKKIKRETKNNFVLCCIARHVKQKTLNFLIESFSILFIIVISSINIINNNYIDNNILFCQ